MFLTLFFFRTWFAFLAVDRDVYAIRTIHIDSIEGFCKHIYIYRQHVFFHRPFPVFVFTEFPPCSTEKSDAHAARLPSKP